MTGEGISQSRNLSSISNQIEWPHENIWTTDIPWSQLNFTWDWDYFISHGQFIRETFYKYQIVPFYDPVHCGQESITNPQHFAGLWTSLLFYLFQPMTGLIVGWILMSIIGYVSLTKILRKYFHFSNLAAHTSSGIWVFNGYFASHFHQGHFTWIGMHWIPILILLSLKMFFSTDIKKYLQSAILMVIITGLLFSNHLPHSLFYAWPIFGVFVLAMPWLLGHNYGSSLKSLMSIIWFHGIGVLLAMWKLFPVIMWQKDHPRQGVIFESHSLLDTLSTLLRWVPTHGERHIPPFFDSQIWGYWEHQAFVSPVILLGLIYLVFRVFQCKKVQKVFSLQDRISILAFLLIVLGIVMSLGNNGTISPGRVFRYLPLLEGIRVFPRFKIITIMGLAIAGGLLIDSLRHSNLIQRKHIFIYLAALALAGPGYMLTGTMISSMKALPDSFVERLLPVKAEPFQPLIGNSQNRLDQGHTFNAFLTKNGVWLTQCYEPMSLKYFSTPSFSDLAIARLFPDTPYAFVGMSPLGINFSFPPIEPRQTRVFLPTFIGMSLGVPYKVTNGSLTINTGDIKDGVLKIKIDDQRATSGIKWSLLGAILLLISCFALYQGRIKIIAVSSAYTK